MGEKSDIEWCDATWNPIRGCTRVSAGCVNCYAERVANRFSGEGKPYAGLINAQGRWNGTVRMVPEHLADPMRWRKPRRVFVNSMSDLFHPALSNEQIAAVFGVMAASPLHTFQVLTKRAGRMRQWFRWAEQEQGDPLSTCGREMVCALGHRFAHEPAAQATIDGSTWPTPNVWIGVSVENQAAADDRIPFLIDTPAAVRFLSCEPLIGGIDLQSHIDGIDWVIAGCESGPGARPCDANWLRTIRDQCHASGTAFFLKQAMQATGLEAGAGSKVKGGGVVALPYLDGAQYAEFPSARPNRP